MNTIKRESESVSPCLRMYASLFDSRPIMQPFRELLKPSGNGKQIYWDDNLTKLFE